MADCRITKIHNTELVLRASPSNWSSLPSSFRLAFRSPVLGPGPARSFTDRKDRTAAMV
jgi:hypothetical protein